MESSIYEYHIYDDIQSFDDIFSEDGDEPKKDNFIITIFKMINNAISALIDSINIILGKKSSRSDIKNAGYESKRLKEMDQKIYGTAKTTLDKGVLLLNKILDGQDVSDETLNTYIKNVKEKTKDIKNDLHTNKLFEHAMTHVGYTNMKNLLLNTKTRIREDARKLYNKETDLEKKNQQQSSVLTSAITGFMKSMSNL